MYFQRKTDSVACQKAAGGIEFGIFLRTTVPLGYADQGLVDKKMFHYVQNDFVK